MHSLHLCAYLCVSHFGLCLYPNAVTGFDASRYSSFFFSSVCVLLQSSLLFRPYFFFCFCFSLSVYDRWTLCRERNICVEWPISVKETVSSVCIHITKNDSVITAQHGTQTHTHIHAHTYTHTHDCDVYQVHRFVQKHFGSFSISFTAAMLILFSFRLI